MLHKIELTSQKLDTELRRVSCIWPASPYSYTALSIFYGFRHSVKKSTYLQI